MARQHSEKCVDKVASDSPRENDWERALVIEKKTSKNFKKKKKKN
jgi:hypothetical protein